MAVCVYGSNRDKFTYCEDIVAIFLKAIKSYPDNYQQLLNAFYPINQARPSSVIIATLPTTRIHFLKSVKKGPIHGRHIRIQTANTGEQSGTCGLQLQYTTWGQAWIRTYDNWRVPTNSYLLLIVEQDVSLCSANTNSLH